MSLGALLLASLAVAAPLGELHPSPEGAPQAEEPVAHTEALAPSTEAPRVAELERRLALTEARLDRALDHTEALEARLESLETEPEPDDQPLLVARPVVVERGQTVPEVVAFGGPVLVRGRVLGRAVSFGDHVRVANGGRVEGDAISFGGRVSVEPGAQVLGDEISYGRSQSPAAASLVQLTGAGDTLRAIARKLVMILTFAGAGVMVVGLFPRRVDVVARSIGERPIRLTLWGMLITSLVGVVSLALGLTVILSPVALLLVLGLAMAWLLGFVGLCQAAGDHIPLANQGARRWLAFLAGVGGLSLVGLLPWVGQAALLLVGFACVGAAFETRLGARDPLY